MKPRKIEKFSTVFRLYGCLFWYGKLHVFDANNTVTALPTKYNLYTQKKLKMSVALDMLR